MRRFLLSLSCAVLLGGPVFAQAQEPLPDSVTRGAIAAASDYLQVPPERLLVVMSAQRDWPDSSMGCPEPGYAYFMVISPGYLVTVDTDDLASEVQVHSNLNGLQTAIC